MEFADEEFVGVFGTGDPGESLCASGTAAAYRDAQVAFGGAPVWQDPATGLVAAGIFIPDNDAASVARSLGVAPESPPLAVITTLFCQHGAAVGRHAPGTFCGAVWDPGRRALTLIRDSVGIRTLYYAGRAGDSRGFWFASRLRRLRRTPVVGNQISLAALRSYLACSYVPGARTMWRDVLELRPGTAFLLPEGKSQTYWHPQEGPEGIGTLPMETYASSLRPVLEDAVRRCLPSSSTPLGVYLSGGLDSSLVTAIAAGQRSGGSAPYHSYAIHFGPDYPNELDFSAMVARHCGTQHRVLELPASLIKKQLAESIAALDDPIGDPLTVPNLLLGKAAQREVGVILNGEGGDPLFGGPKNGPMLLHEIYGGGDESGRIDAYFRSYQKCYDDLPRLLTPHVQNGLAEYPPLSSLLDPFLADDRATMRQYLNRLMQINVDLKGADQILTKVSNLTTACGLMGHSPLFDVRVAEAAFAIPALYKRAGAMEKAVLKAAVADLLPEPILTRPKSGMQVPVQRWFQRDLRRYASGLLLSRHSRIKPYLRQDIIKEWLDYRTSQPFARQGVKLWLVLTLEIWLRENE
ncbi:MAG: asparagine synthase C-terminal domain-containing protein [Armatimonadota bacterium]